MAKVHPRLKQAEKAAEGALGAEGKETIVAELKGIDLTPENPSVQLDSNFVIVTVAEDTEVTVRLRRSGLTGTEVAKLVIKPGASAIVSAGVQAEDEPGELCNGTYVLTLQSTAKKLSKFREATIQAAY